MTNAGTALMGIGTGSGEKRALMAIKQAISSPLLDISIEGAKGVLFNIVGGPDLSMLEINEAASIIAKSVDPDAEIIFGAVIDQKMMDQVRLTLIATRFDEGRLRLFKMRGKTSLLKEEKPAVSSKAKEDKEKKEELLEETFLEEEDEFDIPAFLRKK